LRNGGSGARTMSSAGGFSSGTVVAHPDRMEVKITVQIQRLPIS
jgi:hypothetical protein